MNKPIKPNITIPESFAENGIKTDFDSDLMTEGFDSLNPDVLAGDNLNKFIDDTYKGLNYGMAAADAINLINEGETLTVIDGKLTSGSSGSSRNIGELVTSLLPQTDAGLHLVDGALINGDGAYADFVNYIAELYGDGTAIPSYFTDEVTWQTSVTNYGVCGKFVYDNLANTVRLPKVTGIIEGTIDVSALGDLVEAGLPNITGNVPTPIYDIRNTGAENSALYMTSGANAEYTALAQNNRATAPLNFDASRSSSIYKNNFNKVQPQTIKGFIYICIATSKKTDVEVNIDNVMTDLNGKADTDLTNLTNTGKEFASSLPMPSDRYIDLTLGASGTQYVAPANGYYAIHCQNTSTTDWAVIFQVNKLYGNASARYFQGASALTMVPCLKNDIIYLYYDGTLNTANPYWFRFIYAEGAE